MQYQSPAECRAEGITYHLIPEPIWQTHRTAASYIPEAFEEDGFIHCTNGLATLVEVANRFYRADRRAYRVLVLNVPSIEADVRYDDPDELYPHIYGALNLSAVVSELAAKRADDGTFLGFDEVGA